MDDCALRHWWCDGFIPHCIDPERRCVIGNVWMVDGQKQQQWEFSLMLGENWRNEDVAPHHPNPLVTLAYAPLEQADIDWAALLPAQNLTGWLSMDFKHKHLTLDPARGEVP